MLVAVEQGATVNDAADWALDWGKRHPREALFEYRTYAQWRRSIGTAVWNGANQTSARAGDVADVEDGE
jgi:hypothetical protein